MLTKSCDGHLLCVTINNSSAMTDFTVTCRERVIKVGERDRNNSTFDISCYLRCGIEVIE